MPDINIGDLVIIDRDFLHMLMVEQGVYSIDRLDEIWNDLNLGAGRIVIGVEHHDRDANKRYTVLAGKGVEAWGEPALKKAG